MSSLPATALDPACLIDDPPAALRELGVGPGTLTAGQREALDRDGFLLLPRHMPDDLLAALREAYDRLIQEKYADYGAPAETLRETWMHGRGNCWFHERGTRRLNDLASEDPVFDRLYVDPLLLAAVHHLMRHPFKLDSINTREALPGQGEQGLHRDRPGPIGSGSRGVNSAWLLDDFAADNGPTRVVPGSQGLEADPGGISAHPDERPVLAPAGSLFIFSGHVWHSGTRNDSGRQRRVVHVSFARREQDLGDRAQRLRIRKAVWERISPAARWVLEV